MAKVLNANKKARIYKRDGGICHYCGILCRAFGTSYEGKDAATLDHVQTRAAGGNNSDQNLVLACKNCNSRRSCVPYDLYVHMELWRPENVHKCNKYARLFSIGAQMEKPAVQIYVLELYTDSKHLIDVQNWGMFASAQAVHVYMRDKFPDAILNEDDEPGYIGYHFPADHPLTDVSFVANAWDLIS